MTTGNVVFSRRVVDLLEGGDKVEEVEEEDAEAVVVGSGATTSGVVVADGVDVAALACGLARAPLRATDVVAEEEEEEDGEADGAGGSVGAVAGAVGVAVASPFDTSGSILAAFSIISATCDASVVGPLETAVVVGGDGFLLRGPLRATDAEDEASEVMAAAPAVLFHSSKRRVNSPTPSAEPPLPSSPFFFFFFIVVDLLFPSSPLLLVANPRTTMGRS
jgi:hypothetical protein